MLKAVSKENHKCNANKPRRIFSISITISRIKDNIVTHESMTFFITALIYKVLIVFTRIHIQDRRRNAMKKVADLEA